MSTSKAIFVGIFTAQLVDLCTVLALALNVNFLQFMLFFIVLLQKVMIPYVKRSEKVIYGLRFPKKLQKLVKNGTFCNFLLENTVL